MKLKTSTPLWLKAIHWEMIPVLQWDTGCLKSIRCLLSTGGSRWTSCCFTHQEDSVLQVSPCLHHCHHHSPHSGRCHSGLVLLGWGFFLSTEYNWMEFYMYMRFPWRIITADFLDHRIFYLLPTFTRYGIWFMRVPPTDNMWWPFFQPSSLSHTVILCSIMMICDGFYWIYKSLSLLSAKWFSARQVYTNLTQTVGLKSGTFLKWNNNNHHTCML